MSDAALLEIGLGGGLDETNDDAFVPYEKMRYCQNVVFPDSDMATKRFGLASMTGSTLTNGRKLVTHGNEVLQIDGQQAWAYLPAAQANVSRGSVSPCMATRALLTSSNMAPSGGSTYAAPLVSQGSQAEDPVTKLRVYAWSDGIAVVASVFDTVSGNYILTETVLNSSAGTGAVGLDSVRPRVLIIGSVAFVLYANQALANPHPIVYRSINLASPTSGFNVETEVYLTGTAPPNVANADCWDACVSYTSGGSGPIIAIATLNAGAAAGDYVTLSTWAVSGTAITTPAIGYVQFFDGSYTPTYVTTIGIASAAQTSGAGQVCIVYGYDSQSGSTNSYLIEFAVYSTPAAGNPASVTTSQVIATQNDVDSNKYQQTQAYHAAGVVSLGLVSGVQNWLVTFTADYRISSAAVDSGSPAARWRNTTALQTAVVRNSAAYVRWCHSPIVGYQTASKPFAYTLNGYTGYYVLAMFQDGQRSGVGSFNFLTSAPYNTLPQGAQTLVLMQVDVTDRLPSWRAPSPCAVMAPRFAGNPFPSNADVSITSDGNGAVCIGTEQDAAGNTSLSAIKFNFQDPGLWSSVQLGPWSYIAGGLPMIYDGSTLNEVGFINQPNQPTVGFGAGGSVIPKTTGLTYYIVYTQQDAAGNVHRSPPSVPTVVDSSGGYASVYLGIVPYSVTYRQAVESSANVIPAHPVRIEIYRNNTAGGLTVFQLIDSIPNDTSQAVIIYQDTTVDAAGVTTAPILYTTGNAVPSDGPPNLTALAVHAGRIFGISEDGQTAYFSTVLTRGEAPRFTDAFTLTWPESPVVAQWSLEQRLHAATSDAIFYVYGNGPNENGAGSDITLPSIWQNALGVIDPRAVCIFQNGVLYLSKRGLMFEDRSGMHTWLPQCRRTLATYPVCTGMTALDNDGAIRINLQAADGPGQAGLTIHYDFRHGLWSQHLYSNSTSIGFLSSTVAGGTYYALGSLNFSGTITSGLVAESTSSYLDGTTFVQVDLWPGWVHSGGMQGFQRLHRVIVMGTQNTPCQVEIQIARDYSLSWDPNVGQWSDTTLTGLSLFQLELTAGVQKCEAFAIRVTDSAPATLAIGTGNGATFKTAMVRFRGKRGEYKELTTTERQ